MSQRDNILTSDPDDSHDSITADVCSIKLETGSLLLEVLAGILLLRVFRGEHSDLESEAEN